MRPYAPTFGEPEELAWGMVLDAVEDAMDVDGLKLWDRGQLAKFHDLASWYVGREVQVPDDWRVDDAGDAYTRAREAGGLWALKEHSESVGQLRPAIWALLHAGVATIAELIEVMSDDDEILNVKGIGTARRIVLLHAVRAYVVAQDDKAAC